MIQKHEIQLLKKPIPASAVSPEWRAMALEIIKRDGYAPPRAGPGLSIELKSLRDNTWRPINFPGETTQFETEADRDAVLKDLTP